MVKKMDTHAVTGFLQALCQLVIDSTWTCIAARMIMAERNDGCIVQDSLLQQNPNIHAHLRDTSLTQPDALVSSFYIAMKKANRKGNEDKELRDIQSGIPSFQHGKLRKAAGLNVTE